MGVYLSMDRDTMMRMKQDDDFELESLDNIDPDFIAAVSSYLEMFLLFHQASLRGMTPPQRTVFRAILVCSDYLRGLRQLILLRARITKRKPGQPLPCTPGPTPSSLRYRSMSKAAAQKFSLPQNVEAALRSNRSFRSFLRDWLQDGRTTLPDGVKILD